MIWGQSKDPVSHMCLAGTIVAFWSLTQEVEGLSPFTERTIFLSLTMLNSMKTLRENSIGLLQNDPFLVFLTFATKVKVSRTSK